MQKKLWICVALLLVIPGLLLTVSCGKKTTAGSGETVAAVEDSAAVIEAQKEVEAAAEAAKKAAEEAETQRLQDLEDVRIQEELLAAQQAEEEAAAEAAAAEQRMIAASMEMFEGEDLYFEFDSSALLSAAQDMLKQKAQWLRDNPMASAAIEGHCDERGTNEYNLALGERRANSAKMFLIDLGISASRLTSISYGEEWPVDMGSNEAAWAKNRRAHFAVK